MHPNYARDLWRVVLCFDLVSFSFTHIFNPAMTLCQWKYEMKALHDVEFEKTLLQKTSANDL